MRRSRHSIRWVVSGLTLTWLATGCGEPLFRFGAAKPAQSTKTGQSESVFDASGIDTSADDATDRDHPTVVQLQFDVMRIELPLDGIRHSTKIWNHVDELQLDAHRCALLARNGFRTGVADADAWPAMLAVFDAHQASSNRRQHVAQAGSPLTLDLGKVNEGETYFYYDGRGRLVGTTFGEGQKYVHIGYALDPTDPLRVTLDVTPEVHCEGPDKQWTSRDGMAYRNTEYRGRMFADLRANITLSAGQFLVIGASEQAATASLIGSRFLERNDGGIAKEVLLLVAPQPVRSGTVER